MTGEDEDAEDVDIDGFRFNGGEFEEAQKVDAILSQTDLVAREKGLDDVLWDKIDSLATFHYFDIDAVLAYNHWELNCDDAERCTVMVLRTGTVPPSHQGNPRHVQGRQIH